MKRFAFAAALLLMAIAGRLPAQAQPQIIPNASFFQAFTGQPFSVSFSVQNPPTGGTPTPWSIVSGTLPAGLSFSPSGVLSGTPSTPQVTTFTVSITYNFFSATAALPPLVLTRTYQFNVDNELRILTPTPLPAATAGTPVAFVITSSLPATWGFETSDLPPSIQVNLTNNSTTMSITGVFPSVFFPTTYSIDLYAFGGTFIPQSANRLFTVTVNPAPTLSPPASLAAAGAFYSSTMVVSGGTPPFTFSILSGSLPPGLSLNSSTGNISGTPSAAGQYGFTARVTDANGATASGQFSINVAPPPLSITTTSLPNGMVGRPYSVTLAASGGSPPYSWSVTSGSLPPGLSLGSGGTLSGQPSTPGLFTFTLTVADSAQGSVSRSFTVRVHDTLRILTSLLPDATVGLPFSAPIDATGGVPSYSFSLAGGALPAGVSLSSGGLLSGSPTAEGDFLFRVRVTDGDGFSADRDLALKVHPRPAILTQALPEGRLGDAYSATLIGRGRAPLSWTITSGSLPAGLTLDAQTGVLSGVPSQPGDFTFQVTLADANQPPLSDLRSFTLRIALPPLPSLLLTLPGDTVPPATQPSFGIQLERPFPVDLNGTVTLSFTPDGDLPPDPAIRFANGGSSVNFTLPAGQTGAIPAAGSLFAFQTGTTAGTITLRVTLRLGSTVLDPDPALVRTIRIPPSGPVITSVVIVRTPAGFEARVTGYSNIRQITGATFRFNPSPGSSLTTSEFSVPVASVFQAWFGSAESRQYGGQFLLVVPFTVQGSFGSLLSLQVTLSNSAGSGSGVAFF
ncbi:MAG: Ig domain-containing protein [Bryobacteraceae bacterium]|nr:Ig domain-containing protein [Bryobacteraceae bacterium]